MRVYLNNLCAKYKKLIYDLSNNITTWFIPLYGRNQVRMVNILTGLAHKTNSYETGYNLK